MNKGERAELKFIATLGCFRSQKVLFKNTPLPLAINKLEIPSGSSCQEIAKYDLSITPKYINDLDDIRLIEFCEFHGISKSGPFSKADVFINNIGYSLKYTNAMPPALINHTRRSGWENAANAKGVSMAALDILVADYWSKRMSGLIGEDIANSDSRSPFAQHLNTLMPFLEYFTFEGTGSRASNHPASEVIEFSDPCDTDTWDLLNKSGLIKSLWPRLIFSMRSGKGMPSSIESLSESEKRSVMTWSRELQGKLKGALHVRIKK
jgi:hypothetical protein